MYVSQWWGCVRGVGGGACRGQLSSETGSVARNTDEQGATSKQSSGEHMVI